MTVLPVAQYVNLSFVVLTVCTSSILDRTNILCPVDSVSSLGKGPYDVNVCPIKAFQYFSAKNKVWNEF